MRLLKTRREPIPGGLSATSLSHTVLRSLPDSLLNLHVPRAFSYELRHLPEHGVIAMYLYEILKDNPLIYR